MRTERLDQQLQIGIPSGVRQLNAVAVGKLLEIIRQLVGARHFCAMDKHRNYRDIPLQGRGSFEPDKIKGVIEAPLAGLILRLGPFSSYDRQEDSTGGHTFVNRFAKIAPGLDGSDIHKDRVFAEVANEIVEEASRFAFRVIPTVAEEDCPHFTKAVSSALPAPTLWTIVSAFSCGVKQVWSLGALPARPPGDQ